jgi:hypothetical protein
MENESVFVSDYDATRNEKLVPLKEGYTIDDLIRVGCRGIY